MHLASVSYDLLPFTKIRNKLDLLFMSFVLNLFSFFLLNSYYVNGRDTSLEDFLDPEVLDTLATKINEVLEVPE